METLAAMMVFNRRTKIGDKNRFERHLLLNNDVEGKSSECKNETYQEDVRFTAAKSFRFGRRLESKYGRNFIDQQRSHAKTIFRNIQSSFIHRLRHMQSLSTATRDILIYKSEKF